MVRVEQALHGYTHGHQCITTSPGVTPAALHVLDRMTDYTGPLPWGHEYPAYFQGFPCGEFYAFTATWADHTAPRSGAVLTHSLLFQPWELAQSSSPAAWTRLHRRPKSALDVEPYRKALVADDPTDIPPPPSPELTRLLAAGPRPVLRVTPATGLDLVAGVWAAMVSPADRFSFAFCTLALGMVKVNGRAFDYLQCPPSAVSLFWAMASSPVWWADDRRNPILASVA